jgi:hypothetical protein
MVRILAAPQPNANRKTLHDLDVISARILRRQQTEQRSGGTGHLLDPSAKLQRFMTGFLRMWFCSVTDGLRIGAGRSILTTGVLQALVDAMF